MSTPAWQKRESERQEFNRELHQMVINATEEMDEETNEFEAYGFAVKLMKIFLDFFDDRNSEYSMDSLVEQSSDSEIGRKAYLVWQELLGKVRKFERSEEEGNDILARLFERDLVPGAMLPFHAKISRQQMEDPEMILHASSSNDEV